MKIVCIGGGAAGLYFALLMKRRHPGHEITVVERNRPFDTFGWEVVFSDPTMQSMRQCDPETAVQTTRLAWEGVDQPLDESGWPLMSASPLPYLPHSQVPRAMLHDDMGRVLADFILATRYAAHIGFDILELHAAHGYLLSSFLSPLTNRRTDEYGGSHENRARFPLEVFQAIRATWPDDKPISIRLSTHDWFDGENTPEDAAIFASMFKDVGADLIDCSSGQVVKEERAVYGRLFQTPFSDKIRNEIDVPTIAVSAISEADHVNSIIAAGRAGLCAVARPHLASPSFVMHEAARIGYAEQVWPRQYYSARARYDANLARAAADAGKAP
jgi:anthraniloyl-CoA monooxygenase